GSTRFLANHSMLNGYLFIKLTHGKSACPDLDKRNVNPAECCLLICCVVERFQFRVVFFKYHLCCLGYFFLTFPVRIVKGDTLQRKIFLFLNYTHDYTKRIRTSATYHV